jgi:hypothetical protein
VKASRRCVDFLVEGVARETRAAYPVAQLGLVWCTSTSALEGRASLDKSDGDGSGIAMIFVFLVRSQLISPFGGATCLLTSQVLGGYPFGRVRDESS